MKKKTKKGIRFFFFSLPLNSDFIFFLSLALSLRWKRNESIERRRSSLFLLFAPLASFPSRSLIASCKRGATECSLFVLEHSTGRARGGHKSERALEKRWPTQRR